MAKRFSRSLSKLEALQGVYGNGVAQHKLSLLEELEGARLERADPLLRLHELLCVLRAYPDDADVLARVERMLDGFDRRRDLRDHRRELVDSGIAGTTLYFSFFWFTARWLARRWPERLFLDWPEFGNQAKLEGILHLLMPYGETPALDMLAFRPREWLSKLKGEDETDAVFLIRRFESLASDAFGREALYESLDPPLRIDPGPDTPSRTRAKYAGTKIVFQKEPLSRARPDLRREMRRPPRSVRAVPRTEAGKMIDLVREAMVTRHRDLYAFSHANPDDIRLVDCGRGLQFLCVGLIPLRRLIFEANYGFLTLKNGVPIGYVLASSLFGSTEIAYNVFESFRGAEAATVFGRVMATARQLFDSDTFSIDPYQLGHNNREGLDSGAWWFYYKLGFRPHDAEVRRLVRRESARLQKNPKYRSSISTLKNLAAEHMFLHLKRPRADVLGRISLGHIGLRVSRWVAERYGADRERATRDCAREAARLLGVRSTERWKAGERLTWQRWSPLILTLPGIEEWTQSDRRALVQIVRAKGGRRESDYVPLFNRHRRLRRALLVLAREDDD